jgi:hypothetical protein
MIEKGYKFYVNCKPVEVNKKDATEWNGNRFERLLMCKHCNKPSWVFVLTREYISLNPIKPPKIWRYRWVNERKKKRSRGEGAT